MAKTVSIVITDDLDGVTYEIDLAAANRAKLAAGPCAVPAGRALLQRKRGAERER